MSNRTQSAAETSASMTGGMLSSQIYIAYRRLQSIRQAAESGDVRAASQALAGGITNGQISRQITSEPPKTASTVQDRVASTLANINSTITTYDQQEAAVRRQLVMDAAKASVESAPESEQVPPPTPQINVHFSVNSLAEVDAMARENLEELDKREAEIEATVESVERHSATPIEHTETQAAEIAEEQRQRMSAMWMHMQELVEKIRRKHVVAEQRYADSVTEFRAEKEAWELERSQLENQLSAALLEVKQLQTALEQRPVLEQEVPYFLGPQGRSSQRATVLAEKRVQRVVETLELDATGTLKPGTPPAQESQEEVPAQYSARGGCNGPSVAVGSLDYEFSPRRRKSSVEAVTAAASHPCMSITSHQSRPSTVTQSSQRIRIQPPAHPESLTQQTLNTSEGQYFITAERVLSRTVEEYVERPPRCTSSVQADTSLTLTAHQVQTEEVQCTGPIQRITHGQKVVQRRKFVDALSSAFTSLEDSLPRTTSRPVSLIGDRVSGTPLMLGPLDDSVPTRYFGLPPTDKAPIRDLGALPELGTGSGSKTALTLSCQDEPLNPEQASALTFIEASIQRALTQNSPLGPLTMKACKNFRSQVAEQQRIVISGEQKAASAISEPTLTLGATQQKAAETTNPMRALRIMNLNLRSQLDQFKMYYLTYLKPERFELMKRSVAGERLSEEEVVQATEYEAAVHEFTEKLRHTPSEVAGINVTESSVQTEKSCPRLATDEELLDTAKEALLADGADIGVLRSRLLSAVRGLDRKLTETHLGDGSESIPLMPAEYHVLASNEAELGMIQTLATIEADMDGNSSARVEGTLAKLSSIVAQGTTSPRPQRTQTPSITPNEVAAQSPSPSRRVRLVRPRALAPVSPPKFSGFGINLTGIPGGQGADPTPLNLKIPT